MRAETAGRRRPATSNIPRPHIARETARAAAACLYLTDSLATLGGFSADDALAAVTGALQARTVGLHEDVVVDALSAAAYSDAQRALADAAAEVARLTDTPDPAVLLRAGRGDDEALRAALGRAGVTVDNLSPHSLAPYRRRLAVRAVERVRAISELVTWIRDGALRDALVHTYRSTELGEIPAAADSPVAAGQPDGPEPAAAGTREETLDAVIGRLGAAGLDAERLAWAVIGFEMHKHINLIWHQANKIAPRLPDRAAADLVGWGWQGLRLALRNYDPGLGFLFSTYACARITGSILDGVRSEHYLPKRLTTYQRKVNRAEEELTQALGRVPTLAEVASHLGESLEDLARMRPRMSTAASIEELSDAYGERITEPTCLIDPSDPADEAVGAARREALRRAVELLPEPEATVIRMLDLEERSVADAAAQLGIAPRQLRARRTRALAGLRALLVDWDPAVTLAG